MANKTKYVGIKQLVDPETGELITINSYNVEVEGRKNFFICYLYNVMKVFDCFGGKKYKVLEFIVDNMNNDNQLLMTIDEIQEKTNISRQTITDTLKILETNNLIVRKTRFIMLNPKLFNNKSANKENAMLISYNQIKNENKTNNQIKIENNISNTNTNEQISLFNEKSNTNSEQMTLDEFAPA